MKWIAAMESGEYLENDGGCLAFYYNGEIYYSPMGVLCAFLDPNGWVDGPYGQLLFHGETFVMPAAFRKKVKAKTEWFEVHREGSYCLLPRSGLYADDRTITTSVDDLLAGEWYRRTTAKPFAWAIKFVEENYQWL